MSSEGWKILMDEVIDNEMFAAMDSLFSISVSDPELELKYAYLKGQIDFIHSIYEMEIAIRSPEDGDYAEVLASRKAGKIKSIYRRIVGAIIR